MTANQIANESNRIDRYNAETNRYNYEREKERDAKNYEISTAINKINQDSLNETVRHNKIIEDLQSQAQDIERRKVDIDEQYKMTMAEIQKEYNAKYLEIQQSQGDERLRLEAEANSIQEKKNIAEYEMTQWQNRLKEESNEIQAQYLEQQALHEAELERSNKMREKLESSAQTIKLRELESKERLFEKQLSYDKQRDLLDRGLRMNELNAKLLQWQQQYNLGISSALINLGNLQFDAFRYQNTGAAKETTESVRNIFNSVSGAVNAANSFRLFDLY